MSNVVELRQYTLKPGQRDTLIALFEREFVESQEAVGIELIGTFRDLDDPDRFVWLRGFPDMESRAKSLGAFYGGPVWKAHREAANATMIDSDNVLLLRPAWDGSAFARNSPRRTTPGMDTEILAAFVTEPGPNNFPALPVREGENVFVWFARHRDAVVTASIVDMKTYLTQAPEVLRLSPTARSRLQL